MRIKRRARQKKQTPHTNKTIIIVLFVLLIAISTAYAFFSSSVGINGVVELIPPHRYSGWGKVTATLENTWGDPQRPSYQYNLKIENTSHNDIDGWEIRMNIPTDTVISGGGNGLYTIENGILIITDTGEASNKLITPGNSRTPYIQFNTSDVNFEVTFLMLNGVEMNLSNVTVDPTAITLNDLSTTLYVGETQDLIVIFTPSNGTGTVTWTSSNNSIATVNSEGVVTAVSAGNCYITATCNSLTARCNVSVLSTASQSSNLEVDFTVATSWPSGSKYCIQYNTKIKNISSNPVNGWSFELELPAGSSYMYGWNATAAAVAGTTYRMTGTHTIQPGQTNTEFGFTLEVPNRNYMPIAVNIQP